MASPSEVKIYLQERGRSSLPELAVHFGVSADTMRALLWPWLSKKKVRCIAGASHCGGSCSKGCCCAGAAAEIYEWSGGG